jgi:hypothetical protein
VSWSRAVGVVASAAALALTGCQESDDAVASHDVHVVAEFRPDELPPEYVLGPATPDKIRHDPTSVGPAYDLVDSAAWVNEGEYLAVVTYGSSSCPRVPVRADVADDGTVRFALERVDHEDVCSADVAPHYSILEVPDGLSPESPARLLFGDREATLPASDSG